MKRRLADLDTAQDAIDALASALAGMKHPPQIRAFLEDLCTPAELESLSDRWRVVPLLLQGMPYRDIHERTQVSVTTIGRVARTIERGTGGYAAAMHRKAPALR